MRNRIPAHALPWCSVSSWAYILLEKLPMWLRSCVLSLPGGLSASVQLLQDSAAGPPSVSWGCQVHVWCVCPENGSLECCPCPDSLVPQ